MSNKMFIPETPKVEKPSPVLYGVEIIMASEKIVAFQVGQHLEIIVDGNLLKAWKKIITKTKTKKKL